MTTRKRKKPDCRKCGICCVSYYEDEGYANLTDFDKKRLGSSYVRRNVVGLFNPMIRTRKKKMRTGPFKGEVLHACASLRGSVFNCVSCAVYEKRPSVCRQALKPGDHICRDARDSWLSE